VLRVAVVERAVAVVERAAVLPALARHVVRGVAALLPGQAAPALGVTLALGVIGELDVSVLHAQAGLLDEPVSLAALPDGYSVSPVCLALAGLEQPLQAVPARRACLALADSPPVLPVVPRFQACLVRAGWAPLPPVVPPSQACLPLADSQRAEPQAASQARDGCPCLPPAAWPQLLLRGAHG
jgi:hypothetical protein